MTDCSQIRVLCDEELEKRKVKMMMMLSTEMKTTATAKAASTLMMMLPLTKTRAFSFLVTESVDVRRMEDTFLKFVLPLPTEMSQYVVTLSNELFRLIESIVMLLMLNHFLMTMI